MKAKNGTVGLILFSLGLVLIFLAGCRKDEPKESLPTDTLPTIRRTLPVQASAVAQRGQVVSIRYTLADNQELFRWNVTETVVGNIRTVDTTIAVGGKFRDTTLLKADTIRKAQEIHFQALNGNVSEQIFQYTVPNVNPFQRVILRATVLDNKRQSAYEDFIITVDVDDRDTLARYFRVLDYTALTPDTVYNYLANNFKSAFNLIAREHVATNNPAAKDIEETTRTEGEFDRRFTSPASAPDSAFVIVSQNDFNFDQLTYATMWQAFNTRRALKTTPTLKVGDVVLVKLMLRHQSLVNFPHYAALRIEQIVTVGGGEDYIVFRYKRSQDL